MKHDNTVLKELDNKLISKFDFVSNYINYKNDIYVTYISSLYELMKNENIQYDLNDLFSDFYYKTNQHIENLNGETINNFYSNYIKFLIAYYLSIKFNIKDEYIFNIYNNLTFNINCEEVGYHNTHYEYNPNLKFNFNKLAYELINNKFGINIENNLINFFNDKSFDANKYDEILYNYKSLECINNEFNNILNFIKNFKNNK